MSVGFAPKNLLRVAVIAVIASATGACSTLESLNPFGDDDAPAATASDDTAAPSADQTADNSAAAPDLADVPDRPAKTATPDSQREVAQSLASDRSRAKYSADALRGGTDTAAAPPAPPSAADTATDDTSSSSAPSAAPSTITAADNSSSDDDSTPPPPTPAATADSTPPPPAQTTQVASAPVPPTAASGDGQPAVPRDSAAGVPGAQAPVMSDAQLGFQPSQAPPLDASVSQFVAPSILSRYRQTSSGNVALASSAVPNSATPVTRSRHSRRGVGGPDEMSGSVVANLDSLSGVPAVSSAPAVYAGPNGTPSSVVLFSGDRTVLSASGKAQVRAAAAAYKAAGATGFVRVVGHASSRTGNMPLERHLVVIFEKSQQRANSVAQELIRDGVPADKVLVEAVGDSQPVYYESMPKGEDGNRRAEIFLQS
jgi:outer membrane protein OmpA-like peptidoglycan-associated protein